VPLAGGPFSHAPPGLQAVPTMPAAGVWGCWATAWDQALGPAGEGKAEAATVGVAGTSDGLPGGDQVWVSEGLVAGQPAAEPGADARQGNATDHGAGRAGSRVVDPGDQSAGPPVVTAARSAAPPLAGLAGAVVAVPGSASAAPDTNEAGTALARCQ
jgi:hypothetical protein